MQQKPVLPGDALSTEEEFEPGANAFAEDGNIFASAGGTVTVDAKHKLIGVQPAKHVKQLQPGAIVFATVVFVKESSVIVSLLPGTEKNERLVISQSSAMLPVRNVSRDYVENLRDCFRIGDLIKARVTKASNLGVDLATAEPELGVVKAFCVKCRHPLHLFGSSLKCLNCGNSEQRKTSKDYLLK